MVLPIVDKLPQRVGVPDGAMSYRASLNLLVTGRTINTNDWPFMTKSIVLRSGAVFASQKERAAAKWLRKKWQDACFVHLAWDTVYQNA